MVMNRAPLVEMTLFRMSLATSILAVGVDTSGIVDPFAAHGEASAIGFGLLRSHSAHKLPIVHVTYYF